MIASVLIKEDILPLTIDDSISEAIIRMNEYKVSHFPVVENGKFIGIISEKEILDPESTNADLKKEFLHFDNYYLNEHQYIYDVLKLASSQKLSIIPVVDDAGLYVGSITQGDIVTFFAESMAVDLPGGVFVIEVSTNDYSLTEIANIIETNDAKVLSIQIVSNVNSSKLEIIAKVSKIELGAILQTMERYGYKIIASFQESVDYDELRDNYDSLINYLNI